MKKLWLHKKFLYDQVYFLFLKTEYDYHGVFYYFSAMINSYEMYRRMENDDIILAFKGDITEELLASVFQIMEWRLEKSPAELRLKKKVNNILVECLQNVYHHMKDFTEHEEHKHYAGTAMFIICQDKNNRIRIITGNYLLNSDVENLKNKMDSINTMTSEELKLHYRDKLKNASFSEKGGAGLGMIDIARKSGNKLDYRFDPLNERISFFSLMISVDWRNNE